MMINFLQNVINFRINYGKNLTKLCYLIKDRKAKICEYVNLYICPIKSIKKYEEKKLNDKKSTPKKKYPNLNDQSTSKLKEKNCDLMKSPTFRKMNNLFVHREKTKFSSFNVKSDNMINRQQTQCNNGLNKIGSINNNLQSFVKNDQKIENFIELGSSSKYNDPYSSCDTISDINSQVLQENSNTSSIVNSDKDNNIILKDIDNNSDITDDYNSKDTSESSVNKIFSSDNDDHNKYDISGFVDHNLNNCSTIANKEKKLEIKLKENETNDTVKIKEMKYEINETEIEISDKNDQSKHQKLQPWKPMGFANPMGYCYLNCAVQILVSCKDFRNDLVIYNWSIDNENKDSVFVNGFFNLIKALTNSDKDEVEKSLKIVQDFITENSSGDDVYKCFMNILTRISNVLKTDATINNSSSVNVSATSNEKANVNFLRFKNRHPGFVFDNFYGQLAFQTICPRCKNICNESFQMMKSLALPVPNSVKPVTLKQCIDLFFQESDIDLDEEMINTYQSCNCEIPKSNSFKSIIKITHAPQYLFIYLNRGSYNKNGTKNDTIVTCDFSIEIETTSQILIIYDLIGVIDHVGDSSGGHYYCKCNYEEDKWWLLNDIWVDELDNDIDIVTKATIVFLFKKKNN